MPGYVFQRFLWIRPSGDGFGTRWEKLESGEWCRMVHLANPPDAGELGAHAPFLARASPGLSASPHHSNSRSSQNPRSPRAVLRCLSSCALPHSIASIFFCIDGKLDCRYDLSLRNLSYPVAPNSGKTSCSARTMILFGFLRAAGSGLRKASTHSVSEICQRSS